jgi:hypothetical protein
MTANWFDEQFPGVIPQSAWPFIRFLEARGRKFCETFGYENAEDHVWEILEREEEQRLNLGGKGAVVN